ncbi:MAG: sigma-70 family RNA polymerase sigma factor [Pirellulaceae bacterium]
MSDENTIKPELIKSRSEGDPGRYLADGDLFIVAIKNRNAVAMDEIAIRVQATLKGILRKQHGKTHWGVFDVDDVTQELFLRVVRKIDTYDPKKSKPISWCLSIGLHVWTDLLRREKSWLETLSLLEEPAADTKAIVGRIESDEKQPHSLDDIRQVRGIREDFEQWSLRMERSPVGECFKTLKQSWKAVLFVEYTSSEEWTAGTKGLASFRPY